MNDTKISQANLISLIGMPKFGETYNVHNLSHTWPKTTNNRNKINR